MQLIRDLNQLEAPLENPVLTIGNFDGVHKGHLALFDKVKERAAAIGGRSAVMTFEPHPIRVMKPGNGPKLITLIEQKLDLIDRAGIDITFCLPFDREFAAVSAEDFVRDILLGTIGVKEIVVGYDYAFGAARRGNIDLLRDLGKEHGFAVHVVDPIRINGTPVSSTSVRNLVREGNLEQARQLLGRHYQVSGTVVKGRNRGGRLLGFPTANLNLADELIPAQGVYAVLVEVEGEIHRGVTNIGFNPTFGNGVLSIETHILDFSEELLGRRIQVHFLERLRSEQTFESVEALARQISLDIERARETFDRLEAE